MWRSSAYSFFHSFGVLLESHDESLGLELHGPDNEGWLDLVNQFLRAGEFLEFSFIGEELGAGLNP